MNIVIVGAGITGSELARRLISRKHDVTLIERDEETARHAANRLDCMVIHAAGNDTQILIDANIYKADALIAVTDSDELNMIICGIADSLAPDVVKIARVRNENYVKSLNTSNERTLGINSLVYPDEEAALAIIKIIEHGAVSDILSFNDSSYEITQFAIGKGSKVDGVTVRDLHGHVDSPFIVVAVQQENRNRIPSGDTLLSAGDRVSILTKPEHVQKFYTLAGFETLPFKRIAVVGMSRIGKLIAEYLAKKMHTNSFKSFFGKSFTKTRSFSIVEKDEKTAKAAAAEFPSVTVYNADITDEAFAEEIGLDSFDLVISTTENYESNMITSTYLKTFGVYKTIALVQSSIMKNIAYKIGIDAAISFKDVVVDTIMGKLLGKNVTSFHSMCGGSLEIIELSISENSPAVGKTLKDIAEHGIFLVLLVNSESEYTIPTGGTELHCNDKLIFIVKSSKSDEIIRLFSGEK